MDNSKPVDHPDRETVEVRQGTGPRAMVSVLLISLAFAGVGCGPVGLLHLALDVGVLRNAPSKLFPKRAHQANAKTLPPWSHVAETRLLGLHGLNDLADDGVRGSKFQDCELSLFVGFQPGNLVCKIGSLAHPFVLFCDHPLVEAGMERARLDDGDVNSAIELRHFLAQGVDRCGQGELGHRIGHEKRCGNPPSQ